MNVTKGDIYYAYLDSGMGSEQCGYRPVLIVQNNVGNKFSPTVIVASITSSKTKKTLPTHVHMPKETFGLPENSVILTEQIYTIDKARLFGHIGHLDSTFAEIVDKALSCSLGISKEVGKERGSVNNLFPLCAGLFTDYVILLVAERRNRYGKTQNKRRRNYKEASGRTVGRSNRRRTQKRR